MAGSSVSIPSSLTAASTKNIKKEYSGLRRSESSKDLLCNKASIRRSYSDNHLQCSINCIRAASVRPKLKNSRSFGIFPFQISSSIIPHSLRTFLFDPETSKDMNVDQDKNAHAVESTPEETSETEEVKRANWVERLLEIRSHWKKRKQNEDNSDDETCDEDEKGECDCGGEDGCIADYNLEEEGGEVKYDRDTFSRFLTQVPLSDTKVFSKLAFLCNMAYVIPEIKSQDLKRYCALRFVTSSLENKAEVAAIKAKLDEDSTRVPVTFPVLNISTLDTTEKPAQKRPIRPSVAYDIAASAASYVQSRAQGLLSRGTESPQDCHCASLLGSGDQPDDEGESSPRVYKSEVAAYVAATTMTVVVAADEKQKQEAARDLQSIHSSPCEWFVCDDVSTYTRCFVIQGSDSLASWQANLFFEPAKFEETEVPVHRGIYEAAKGIYQQFMPLILEHLNTYGERAKFQFTGHSLGGSLSLLVNFMLLTRNVVKPSTLRPVVTFGSPFIFCGGQKILNDLGLDDDHVHCVMMHRDIVPRAFSCNYPNHVALLLKRLNPFRSHPCLIKNKLLYSPLGKLFILQPDEKSSPPHPLLPPGSALYALNKTQCGFSTSPLKAFLNCPHPVDTLSDPTAYGSDGTILRDHDSSNYLKAVNGVLKQNTKVVQKVRKERNLMWPLLTSPSPHSWNQNNKLESSLLATKEVMTGA